MDKYRLIVEIFQGQKKRIASCRITDGYAYFRAEVDFKKVGDLLSCVAKTSTKEEFLGAVSKFNFRQPLG